MIIFDDSKIIFISVPALHQQTPPSAPSTLLPFVYFAVGLIGDAAEFVFVGFEPIDEMLYLMVVHILFDGDIVFEYHFTIIISFLFKT